MTNTFSKNIMCYHKDTKKLLEIVAFSNKDQTVTVVQTEIKANGEVVDRIEATYPLSKVDILVYIGRQDRLDREILEHEEIQFGEGLRYKGHVTFNPFKSRWVIVPDEENPPGSPAAPIDLSEIASNCLHKLGKIHEEKDND